MLYHAHGIRVPALGHQGQDSENEAFSDTVPHAFDISSHNLPNLPQACSIIFLFQDQRAKFKEVSPLSQVHLTIKQPASLVLKPGTSHF